MKINNKGFTLIELLAVIVLLAVIITIAVPSIMGVSRNIKKNMLDTKIDLIIEDAKLYGQDNMSEIAKKSTKYDGHPCTIVTIKQLVEQGYLSEDEEADPTKGKILNPVDNSYLDEQNIIIYIKNRRAAAVMADPNLDGNNENSCS